MKGKGFFSRIFANWPAKILSLAAAVVIFMFYRMSNLEERFFSVPVHVILPEGFAISSDYEKSVKVTIRGDADKIYPILENDIFAFVDLRDHRNAGRYKEPVKIEKRGTAKDIESIEIRVDPAELTVTIEEIVTKPVKVKAVIRGSPLHGYELVQYSVTPQRVLVSGPKSHVERLKEIPTEEVDVSGRDSNFTVKVRLVLDDSYVKIKGNDSVDFYAAITEALILKSFKGIDIISLDLDPALRLASSLPAGTIRVQGPQLLVESINSGQLRLIVNCSKIKKAGRYLLPVTPDTPEGIIVLSYEPKEILLEFVPVEGEESKQ